jgi:hypothetical protein
VVRDDVDDDPDAQRVRLGDQLLCLGQAAEQRLDRAVAGHIWKIRKKMIVGIAAMAEAAMMRFSGVVAAPVIPTLIVSLVGV